MRQKSDLRPYQQRVVTELYNHDERLVIMRPGTGKTIAALTAIRELLDDKVIRHALIVGPKRVARSVWPDEIVAWAHTAGLRYKVLDGSPVVRKCDMSVAHQRDITVIGIDLLPWLVDELKINYRDDAELFDLLVIDEVSKLRDPTGKRAKALASIADRWKMIWGLSGTLRPSGPLDLFMPARVVTRGKLWGKSFYKWRAANFHPKDQWGYEWLPFPDAEDKLNAELAPLTVTLAEDEAVQLPDLQIILDHVELPDTARRNYDDMERKLITGSVIAANAAVATGKLAQIANGFVYDGGNQAVLMHDEKIQWLENLIEEAAGPTLLIYEFRWDLRVMRERFKTDLPFIGPGVSDKTTADTIRDWNAGRLPFMALHPASGGHGLNLQHGGCDMAWMSPTWSPELYEQCIARLYRSGQTKPVIVRVCVAKDTVDEMKLDRVHHKMTAQAAFEKYLQKHRVIA